MPVDKERTITSGTHAPPLASARTFYYIDGQTVGMILHIDPSPRRSIVIQRHVVPFSRTAPPNLHLSRVTEVTER